MATLVFLHGLNTYGDDLLHVGPITFGTMHAKLEQAFRERDIDFIPVTGLGFGSPEEQAERALNFLAETGLGEIDTDLHILGQSIGGLVARALAARPEIGSRVRTILTMGTPHDGSTAALFGLEFAEKYPRWSKLFAAIGYDTRAKAEIFRNFTPESVRSFNARFPAHPDVHHVCLLCEVDRASVSWPLLGIYEHLHPETSEGPPKSDGFIPCSSQSAYGEVTGPFALDHFAQLGYFFHPRRAVRRRSEAEFERLVDTIAKFVSKRDRALPENKAL